MEECRFCLFFDYWFASKLLILLVFSPAMPSLLAFQGQNWCCFLCPNSWHHPRGRDDSVLPCGHLRAWDPISPACHHALKQALPSCRALAVLSIFSQNKARELCEKLTVQEDKAEGELDPILALTLWQGLTGITLGCVFPHSQEAAPLLRGAPCAVKVLKSLKTTLKSNSCSFYGLSFVFSFPLLTFFICSWEKTEKKATTGKKWLCRDEPQQCNLSMSVKTYPPLLLFG